MATKYDLSAAVLLSALLIFGLVYFLFNKNAKSEVIISDRMSEFIDAIDQSMVAKSHQLIVFDLDDTVFRSSSILGTPTWYYHTINILRQNGAPSQDAFYVVNDIDKVIQENVKVMVVEQSTITAIKRWQSLGATIVGVSSRPSYFQEVTEKHLKQIGSAFNAPVFQCVEQQWSYARSVFKGGVIYAGKKISKDQAFIKFHDLAVGCGLSVELIGQADDQQRYISKVSQYAQDSRINYLGIIYGGALSRTEFNVVEAGQKLLELETRLKRVIVPQAYRSVLMGAR